MENLLKKVNHANLLKEKIEWIILKNRDFSKLLKGLRDNIQSSISFRHAIGISKICAACGAEKKDCCGKGIELRYTPELLALNIFFGVNIPARRRFSDSCYFLSEKGCILLVRDVFCINFLCSKIKDSIPLDNLKRLWELEGLETEIIFKVTEFLKN
ncbi:MAG: hypothetical protein N2257_07590 [Thermodesulfovibrionales bacterium]|nr:hypothetical protein [Thermodesulfovibrionales bacterium]